MHSRSVLAAWRVWVYTPPPTPPPQDSSRVVFCLSTRAHLNSLSATCMVCRWKTHQRARFCTVTGGWCSAGQHTGLGVRHSAAGGLDKRSAGCQIRVARLWAVCSSSTEVRHKCVITATPHESCVNQANSGASVLKRHQCGEHKFLHSASSQGGILTKTSRCLHR